MSRDRLRFAGLGACLRFELAKLLPRVLPWLAILVTIFAIVVEGTLSRNSETPLEGYRLFAMLLGDGVLLTSFFLLVLGCLSVNEEISSGSLRAVLLRPAPREVYILAKLIVLIVFAMILGLIAVATAWIWTAWDSHFQAIVLDLGDGLESPIIFDADTVAGHARRLSWSILPSILCAPLFGVLISILVESSGFAVVLGLLGWAAFRVVGELGGEWATWSFPYWTERPLQLLKEVAEGIKTNERAVLETDFTSPQVMAPLGMALILASAALLIFRWKEIRC
ncbi:MAG: ABC transporter permease [Planctomycetes bacterium]|nr:ABC transporter permease [Planctomycetota bacterium]